MIQKSEPQPTSFNTGRDKGAVLAKILAWFFMGRDTEVTCLLKKAVKARCGGSGLKSQL